MTCQKKTFQSVSQRSSHFPLAEPETAVSEWAEEQLISLSFLSDSAAHTQHKTWPCTTLDNKPIDDSLLINPTFILTPHFLFNLPEKT